MHASTRSTICTRRADGHCSVSHGRARGASWWLVLGGWLAPVLLFLSTAGVGAQTATGDAAAPASAPATGPAATPALPQEPPPALAVPDTPRPPSCSVVGAIDGTYQTRLVGARLEVVSKRAGEAARCVSVKLPSVGVSVVLKGHTAFVALTPSGILRVNLADPTAPLLTPYAIGMAVGEPSGEDAGRGSGWTASENATRVKLQGLREDMNFERRLGRKQWQLVCHTPCAKTYVLGHGEYRLTQADGLTSAFELPRVPSLEVKLRKPGHRTLSNAGISLVSIGGALGITALILVNVQAIQGTLRSSDLLVSSGSLLAIAAPVSIIGGICLHYGRMKIAFIDDATGRPVE